MDTAVQMFIKRCRQKLLSTAPFLGIQIVVVKYVLAQNRSHTLSFSANNTLFDFELDPDFSSKRGFRIDNALKTFF